MSKSDSTVVIRKIILIGGSDNARANVLAQLEKEDEVIAVLDSKPNHMGKNFKGFMVAGINQITTIDWDLIVICDGSMSTYQELLDMHIQPEKIAFANRQVMRGDYALGSFYYWLILFFLIFSCIGLLLW